MQRSLDDDDPIGSASADIGDRSSPDVDPLTRSGRLSSGEADALRAIDAMRRIQSGEEPLQFPGDPEPERGLDRGFETQTLLGKGAFGTVHRAVDRALGRVVAIKVLGEERACDPEALHRFVEEARVLASLDHPNIVRIHQIDEEAGRVRLVLEFVEGRTLEEWVRADGVLAPAEAIRIGIDLCRALAALHEKGLVHGDLKPSNVMRAVGGRIVLLDFGLVRSPSDRGADLGGPMGTPRFMAPEQFEQGAAVGPAADLWALGVLLYWLLTMRFPYEEASFLSLREAVLEGTPAPLRDRRSDLPGDLVTVVERALAREPSARFASAGAFERALRDLLAAADEPAPRSAPMARRVIVVASAVAAIAIVALLLVFRPFRETPQVVAFDLDARLYAHRTGERPRQLLDGASVRPGDQLHLSVAASRDLWIYLFNEDDAGNRFALFPYPDDRFVRGGNPVRTQGGAAVTLPGSLEGKEQYWVIDSSGGGAEHFLLVASPEPLADAEAYWKSLATPELHVPGAGGDRSGGGPSADLTWTSLQSTLRGSTLRGAGKVAPRAEPAPGVPAAASAARPIFGDFERLGDQRIRADGVVVRTIDLRNEG